MGVRMYLLSRDMAYNILVMLFVLLASSRLDAKADMNENSKVFRDSVMWKQMAGGLGIF